MPRCLRALSVVAATLVAVIFLSAVRLALAEDAPDTATKPTASEKRFGPPLSWRAIEETLAARDTKTYKDFLQALIDRPTDADTTEWLRAQISGKRKKRDGWTPDRFPTDYPDYFTVQEYLEMWYGAKPPVMLRGATGVTDDRLSQLANKNYFVRIREGRDLDQATRVYWFSYRAAHDAEDEHWSSPFPMQVFTDDEGVICAWINPARVKKADKK